MQREPIGGDRCQSSHSYGGPPGVRSHGKVALAAVVLVIALAASATSAVGSRHRSVRSTPTLASVLRPLTPTERRYVLGITSLTKLQLWAAFGTTPAPPPPITSPPRVALPILPACAPGPCWRAAPNRGRPPAQAP